MCNPMLFAFSVASAGGQINKSPGEGGGTMVSFHLIGANTQKMCAKKA